MKTRKTEESKPWTVGKLCYSAVFAGLLALSCQLLVSSPFSAVYPLVHSPVTAAGGPWMSAMLSFVSLSGGILSMGIRVESLPFRRMVMALMLAGGAMALLFCFFTFASVGRMF